MPDLFTGFRHVIRLVAEYMQDFYLFMHSNRYSPSVDPLKRDYYKLIVETHTIEKGLSLSSPKPLFGREKIRFIMDSLRRYDPAYSRFPVGMALGALSAYRQFHRDLDIADPFIDEVDVFLQEWSKTGDISPSGGVKSFSFPTGSGDAADALLATRASCRMFDRRPVPRDLLEQLVRLAQRAPSQCNRQSSRVHFYQQQDDIRRLLALQGGSRGFAEHVGNLFVVTSDVAAWQGAEQRNQLYVDGALFAMSILLAAHATDLIACPLNLAVTNAVEREIRQVGAIPNDERLIMMIAIGFPKGGELMVASSPRRNLSEILEVH